MGHVGAGHVQGVGGDLVCLFPYCYVSAAGCHIVDLIAVVPVAVAGNDAVQVLVSDVKRAEPGAAYGEVDIQIIVLDKHIFLSCMKASDNLADGIVTGPL